jgi:hypothetical protein
MKTYNAKRTKYVEGFDSLSGQKEDFSFEFWLEVKDDPLTVYFPEEQEGDVTGWVGTQADQVSSSQTRYIIIAYRYD